MLQYNIPGLPLSYDLETKAVLKQQQSILIRLSRLNRFQKTPPRFSKIVILEKNYNKGSQFLRFLRSILGIVFTKSQVVNSNIGLLFVKQPIVNSNSCT